MSLQDYKEQYNKLTVKKNLFGKKAEEAVEKDGCVLRFVSKQTPKICKLAVQQDGFALQYVKIQTPKICELAIKQDIDALRYVEDKFFK